MKIQNSQIVLLQNIFNSYFLVLSGGTSSTTDSGNTPEISFETNEILNVENQLSKIEF